MKRLRLLRLGKSLVSGSHFIKYSRVLLGNNGLDYEQGGDHERDGYGKVEPYVLDKAGQYEADKRYSGNGDGIRQLGEHMVKMESVRTGGGHYGGI